MSEALILLQRREIKRSLTAWSLHCGFVPAKHHKFCIDRMEDVLEGKIKRLMLLLPPGSAKSTYSSVLLPPHYLGRRPGSKILSCSHSGDLAESFGRKARNLVEFKHKELGFELCTHSKAAGRWETTNGGEYYAAGVGSGIAGYRADLGLIDDPIGKKEDAESKLLRDKQWDWYNYDFLPRLKPNASIILIQTRWHEDDLAGRLLAIERSRWNVVSIPLYAEENDVLGRKVGETLWPEYFTQEHCEQCKANPAFVSLYQCRPSPEDGDYFLKDWLIEYDEEDLPSNLKLYVGSDHAVRKKTENDKHCIIPAGLDSNGDLWILPDVWWKRADVGEAVDAMFDTCKRHTPLWWWAGKDMISGSIAPFLARMSIEKKAWVPLIELPESKDLSALAQPIRGMCRNHRVHFPRFASWWPEAKHELLSFPNGTHDDFIAALSKLGRGLTNMVNPQRAVAIAQDELLLPCQPLTRMWLRRSHEQKVRENRLVNMGN